MAPPVKFTGGAHVARELKATVSFVCYEQMHTHAESMHGTSQPAFMEKKYLGDGSDGLPYSQQGSTVGRNGRNGSDWLWPMVMKMRSDDVCF